MKALIAILLFVSCTDESPNSIINGGPLSPEDSLRNKALYSLQSRIDKIDSLAKIRRGLITSLSDSANYVNIDILKARKIILGKSFTEIERQKLDSLLSELDGFIVSLY